MNPFAIFVGSIYIVYYNYTLNGWQNIHWMKQWASTQKKNSWHEIDATLCVFDSNSKPKKNKAKNNREKQWYRPKSKMVVQLISISSIYFVAAAVVILSNGIFDFRQCPVLCHLSAYENYNIKHIRKAPMPNELTILPHIAFRLNTFFFTFVNSFSSSFGYIVKSNRMPTFYINRRSSTVDACYPTNGSSNNKRLRHKNKWNKYSQRDSFPFNRVSNDWFSWARLSNGSLKQRIESISVISIPLFSHLLCFIFSN